jgi:hypothetical protein
MRLNGRRTKILHKKGSHNLHFSSHFIRAIKRKDGKGRISSTHRGVKEAYDFL